MIDEVDPEPRPTAHNPQGVSLRIDILLHSMRGDPFAQAPLLCIAGHIQGWPLPGNCLLALCGPHCS